jgi:hypothetical protein
MYSEADSAPAPRVLHILNPNSPLDFLCREDRMALSATSVRSMHLFRESTLCQLCVAECQRLRTANAVGFGANA